MKSLLERIFHKPTPKNCLELEWNDEAISLPARSITFNQLHIGVGVRVEDLPTIYEQLIKQQFAIIHLLGIAGQSDRFRQVAMVAGHEEGPHGTRAEKCAAFEKSIARDLRLETFSIDEVRDVHNLWCLPSADHLPFAPAFSKLAFNQAKEVMPLGGYHLGLRPVIIVQEATSLTYEDVKNESAARSVRIGRIVVFSDEEYVDRFALSPHSYFLDNRKAR